MTLQFWWSWWTHIPPALLTTPTGCSIRPDRSGDNYAMPGAPPPSFVSSLSCRDQHDMPHTCYDYAMLLCSCYAPVAPQLCSLHIHNAGSKEVASKLRLASLCSIQPTHCMHNMYRLIHELLCLRHSGHVCWPHTQCVCHPQRWGRKDALKSADYASITDCTQQ